MKIAINDLSFRYPFYEYEDAKVHLEEFIELCKRIESGEMKAAEKIVSDYIDSSLEISPSCKLYTMIASLRDADKKRYLLGLLVNRNSFQKLTADFEMDGKYSSICAWARMDMVVSLKSSELFLKDIIVGRIGRKSVSVRNLSSDIHINTYRNELGLRIYKENAKKHKADRDNPYGKGKVGSQMDLRGREAQSLLNKAIEFKGKLYGRNKGKNYAFQNEGDVFYHGYIAEDLLDDVKAELNKHQWI